jgi:5-methylcytosine-specific restriction endonuclease McrA
MAMKYLEFSKYLKRMSKQVLLLNFDQSPINVINLNKAYKLILKNKVYVDYDSEEFHEVQLVANKIKIPKILILKYYIKLPNKKLSPSRKNIFKRDSYCCQYCGKDLCDGNATVDHVTPRCKGGADSWTNLVTSCKECNLYKGSRSLKEAKMELKNKPKEPAYGFFIETMMIAFKRTKNA